MTNYTIVTASVDDSFFADTIKDIDKIAKAQLKISNKQNGEYVRGYVDLEFDKIVPRIVKSNPNGSFGATAVYFDVKVKNRTNNQFSWGFSIMQVPTLCGGLMCYGMSYVESGLVESFSKLIHKISIQCGRNGVYYTTSSRQTQLANALKKNYWQEMDKTFINQNSHNTIKMWLYDSQNETYKKAYKAKMKKNKK